MMSALTSAGLAIAAMWWAPGIMCASSEGSRVFFTTVERFTLEDGDNEVDVYERFLGTTSSADVTRLVSTGNSPDLELGPDDLG